MTFALNIDNLPPVTPDAPVIPDIYLNGFTIRPVGDHFDALYVGMRIPGAYPTEDDAFNALCDYVTDADAWQRNFRARLDAGEYSPIPGLA